MLRAPRPKTEAVGMKLRIEDRREHLRDGLQIIRSTAAGTPSLRIPPEGLGISPCAQAAAGRCPPRARADLRPVVMKPWPQLLGAHPVDARGTGVLLDASERLGEISAGQQLLPHPRRRGERRCRPAPGSGCALTGGPRASPLDPPGQPPNGVGCGQRDHEHERPGAGFAFGPSERPSIPLVLRRLLTSPRRATPSRASPSRTTPRTQRTGHLGHPWRSPRVRPATFIAHPPRLRNGPLMTKGFAVPASSPGPSRLIRAAPAATEAEAMCS